MRRSFGALVLVLMALAPCRAVPIATFTDMQTFLRRAESIVVARAAAVPGEGEGFPDGVYPAEVDVIRVLHGERKPGRMRIATIYPMQIGKLYLLIGSRGARYGSPGTAIETTFVAVGELTVVPVPPDFDLALLKDQPLEKQVWAIFRARRAVVEALLLAAKNEHEREALTEERRLLDRALRSEAAPPPSRVPHR